LNPHVRLSTADFKSRITFRRRLVPSYSALSPNKPTIPKSLARWNMPGYASIFPALRRKRPLTTPQSCVYRRIVKIDKRELERLRAIEAAARAFKDAVELAGVGPAISALLNKATQRKEVR
jgi:hypothetical protein